MLAFGMGALALDGISELGVPMYNFGPPAQFDAYIDNIVRVGRTFGFDGSRAGALPVLAGAGERLAAGNHVEAPVRTAFAYIGVTDLLRCKKRDKPGFFSHRRFVWWRAPQARLFR